MLQHEGFGVTKERCECVCALSAFQTPCTTLNSKFYPLGTGSALNFMGTAAALVLPLEVGVCGRCHWDLLGDGSGPGAAWSTTLVKHICQDANMYAKEILAV